MGGIELDVYGLCRQLHNDDHRPHHDNVDKQHYHDNGTTNRFVML
jgi:hypothetical protein